MPTSIEEAQKIKQICLKYVEPIPLSKLCNELHYDVGRYTENNSLQVSLEMLKNLTSLETNN